MKFRRPLIRKITAPLLACVLLVTAGGAVASAGTGPSVPLPVPNPAADPFYAQPASFAGEEPGQVLASRAVSVVGLSAAFRVYQVQYVSTDTFGASQADVATILIPAVVSGPPRLVSYQAPIDSLSYNCDPSYELRIGTEEETGMIGTLLLQGWTVVGPDFLRPDHQWVAGDVEAHGTLRFAKRTERRRCRFWRPGRRRRRRHEGRRWPRSSARAAPTRPSASTRCSTPKDGNCNATSARCASTSTPPPTRCRTSKPTPSTGSTRCCCTGFRQYRIRSRAACTVVPKAPTYLYMATNDELVQQYGAAHLVVQYVKIPGDHVSTLAAGFPGALARRPVRGPTSPLLTGVGY